MARKRPEALQALDRMGQQQNERAICADCDAPAFIRDGGVNLCEQHYVARAHNDAMRNMPDELLRQPGESHAKWLRRALDWYHKNATVKRFGVTQ